MKLLIMGDVHAQWRNYHCIIEACQKHFEFDAIIQVGDFGLYESTLKLLLKTFKKPHPAIHFIDGNHEEHLQIYKSVKSLAKNNIFYQKRGSTWDIGGARIGFMGGALNVDRPQPRVFRDGPLLNVPTDEEIVELSKHTCDLMVTHSNPCDIGIGMEGSDFFKDSIKKFITDEGIPMCKSKYDIGDTFLKSLWDMIENKPKHWVFGHHHRNYTKKLGNTIFQCVGSSDNPSTFTPYTYDTNTKELSVGSFAVAKSPMRVIKG